jgi:hypothetical protein
MRLKWYVVDMNGQSTVSPGDETMIIFKTFSFGRFFILNCGFFRGFVKGCPFVVLGQPLANSVCYSIVTSRYRLDNYQMILPTL